MRGWNVKQQVVKQAVACHEISTNLPFNLFVSTQVMNIFYVISHSKLTFLCNNEFYMNFDLQV